MENINKTISMIDKGDRSINEVDSMYNDIRKIAKQYKVDLTDHAYKIAKARVLTNCPLNLCICDRNDPDRGCISEKCMKEIQEKGQCHCKCFCKK